MLEAAKRTVSCSLPCLAFIVWSWWICPVNSIALFFLTSCLTPSFLGIVNDFLCLCITQPKQFTIHTQLKDTVEAFLNIYSAFTKKKRKKNRNKDSKKIMHSLRTLIKSRVDDSSVHDTIEIYSPSGSTYVYHSFYLYKHT